MKILGHSMFVLIAMLLFVGGGCSSIEDSASIADSDSDVYTEETNEGEKENIQESSFEEDGAVVTILKNLDTNEAEVLVTMQLADNEEYVDFLGESIAGAPMAINLVCGLYQYMFFDQEGLADVIGESGGAIQEPDSELLKAELGDANVTMYDITFLDTEDGETIATCNAIGAGSENITFEAMRDYPVESSLFGMEIGVLTF
jgi:hypothetical protein